jgi:hypothetical protein
MQITRQPISKSAGANMMAWQLRFLPRRARQTPIVTRRTVAVPFHKLQFGNANANSDDKLVLSDTNQTQLNNNPVFHYDVSNYASNNPGSGSDNGGALLFGSRNAPDGGAANNPNNKKG